MKQQTMTIFVLKILQLIIIATVAIGSASSRHIYNLRWVTNEPVLPIFIEKATRATSIDSLDYKWLKYPQEIYLDEEEAHDDKYMFSTTANSTVLYILEYNVKTHEQLGTYKPVPMDLRTDSYDMVEVSASPTDPVTFYTLAYLESHKIDLLPMDPFDPNKLTYFCNASVLLPNNKLFGLNEANLRLVERSVSLKMGFFYPTSPAASNLHGRGSRKQHTTPPSSDGSDNFKFSPLSKLENRMSVVFRNDGNASSLVRSKRNSQASSGSFIQVIYYSSATVVEKFC
jgi:hypothetical protein